MANREVAGVDLALDIEAELTPKQAEAVALRVAGYTHKEVAEQLGVTERAVYYRMSNARAHLQYMLPLL